MENFNIIDYINIKQRAKELGCQIPSSLALLPTNFEKAKTKEELHYESTAKTIRKLWRNNNIVETPLEISGKIFYSKSEKSFEWICPTIFCSSALLSQDPHLLNIALNIISNYLTEWFKGLPKNEKIAILDIVIENKKGEYKKLEYKGPSDGLKSLPKIVQKIHNE